MAYKGRRRKSAHGLPADLPPVSALRPDAEYAYPAADAYAAGDQYPTGEGQTQVMGTVGAESAADTPRVQAGRRKGRVLKRLVVAVVVVLLAIGGAGAFAAWRYYAGVQDEMTTQLVKLDPKATSKLTPVTAPGQPFYVLMMGADARPGDEMSNSDTLILARIDPQQKKIALISIPRDTKAEIPGHGTHKINAALIQGGPSLAIETVQQLTGLPISHFVTVDFNGFKDLVDAIGGVYINVPERIFDPKAANHDYTAELILPGYKKLDGKHALTFVRSRRFESSDYQRMKNQQAFIKALTKQTLQAGNIFKINAITNAVVKNVVTDMKLEEILGLVADFKDMNPDSMQTATMPSHPSTSGGADYVILEEDAMREMVARLAAGQALDPDAPVTPATPSTSATSAAGSVSSAPASVDHSSVSIDVRNGAGGSGVASSQAKKLRTAGFVIDRTGDARTQDYAKTLIVYGGQHQRDAQAVQTALGYGTLVKNDGAYSYSSSVLLVVGKDWRAAATGAAATR